MPDRQVPGLVVEYGIVAVRQRAYEVVGAHGFGRRDDLLAGRIGPPVGEILRHGAAEQPRILQHHAEFAAQIASRHGGCGYAVKCYRAAIDLVESHQQVDQRGLARAG